MDKYETTPRDEARFFAMVDITDTCWNWTGCTSAYGYGLFRLNGPKRVAHRVSWSIAKGADSLPDLIDHICRNRVCVNPGHMRAATHKQNSENLSGPTSRSTSGVRGVTWHKRAKKWAAYVVHARKTQYVGLFEDIEDAERAVIARRNELFTYNDLDRMAA